VRAIGRFRYDAGDHSPTAIRYFPSLMIGTRLTGRPVAERIALHRFRPAWRSANRT